MSHDEGIDLINNIWTDNNFACATSIVQCKLYRGLVPVTDLRDFFGVMVAHTAVGLFVTTRRLTAQGKRFLPQANNSSMANCLHMLEGDALRALLDVCERLAEMTIDGPSGAMSKAEYRSQIKALRAKARAIIYSKPKLVSGKAPIQGKLL